MSNTTNIKLNPNAETAWEKSVRKAKEEPLVPIGMALTTAALIGAIRSSRQGNRAQFNRLLRFRVYAQGFTVMAALLGSVYYGDKKRREKMQEAKQKAKDDTNRELEKSIQLAQAAESPKHTIRPQKPVSQPLKEAAEAIKTSK